MPALSAKKTVTTAGAAVQLGSQPINTALAVRALATNTGKIYIGNNGSNSVSSTSGYELSAGESITFQFVADLADLWIDSTVNGEGLTWLILSA